MFDNRPIQPPLRYPGSKYRAFKFIKPFIRNNLYKEYREPFLGSGAVFFQKLLSPINWINDYDEDLINFYKIIQNHELAKQLANDSSKFIPTKEKFDELKNTNPTTNYDKALKYFIINRTAYSGIMNLPNYGFHQVKSVQPDKWPKRIIDASKKLQDVKITCLDYHQVIEAPSSGKTLLFIDPPYFAADQKRAYVKSFELQDHIDLCECLKKTNYDFILTYDNCEEIKQLYSWAHVHEVEFMYNTANSVVTTRKMGKELIITNFSIGNEITLDDY